VFTARETRFCVPHTRTAPPRVVYAADLAVRLKEIHPQIQFGGGAFVTEQLRGQLRQERILALLSSFRCGLTLLLAAIGLFGSPSHASRVSSRLASHRLT
jgi:hypothetical protein